MFAFSFTFLFNSLLVETILVPLFISFTSHFYLIYKLIFTLCKKENCSKYFKWNVEKEKRKIRLKLYIPKEKYSLKIFKQF